MTTAISVKNLGKQYKIGAVQGKFHYNMFRDVIMDTVMMPVRVFRALRGTGMRGTAGTSVKLNVRRPGAPRSIDFRVVRSEVGLPQVKTRLLRSAAGAPALREGNGVDSCQGGSRFKLSAGRPSATADRPDAEWP